MTKERLDAILDRLDALRAATDDPGCRRQIREIQQLVVGLRSDEEQTGERGDDQGSDVPSPQPGEVDPGGAAGGDVGTADED